MSDLISRESVLELLKMWADGYTYIELPTEDAIKKIEQLPSIDAVPVVRCKECKHKFEREDGKYNPENIACYYWESDGLCETDYCSYGERKES